MEFIFEFVNKMMTEGIILALTASFIWGILSIALSPCHLTSIPLIIGFIDSTEIKTTGRRFVLSLLFSLGILLSIIIIGIITASAGRVAGDLGRYANWIAAAVFALIGMSFLEIIPLTFNGINGVPINKKGKRAAFLIGLIFGVALGPCTFAFMAPVMAVTFASESSLLSSSLILTSYGFGHSFLIILAGTFTGALQNYLQWNSEKGHSVKIKKIAGVFLLIGALYFLAK